MRSLKLTLAYDGTSYAGWQVQPGQATVQETLERTLKRVTGEELRVAASGRTDAGVHALGQVVSLQTTTHLAVEVLQRALNAELPSDIAVLELVDAPPGFHARRDAVKKQYRYQIHNGHVPDVFRRQFVWHLPKRLDELAMHRAAQGLQGTHDFSSFETRGAERETSVRTVRRIGTQSDGDRLWIDVEADGFLYNMVRTIVGTLVEVGRGAKPEDWPTKVMNEQNRQLAGPTAPPQGLFLVRVDY